MARHVESPAELDAVLEALPRPVRAPVPTLLRRDGDHGVLFVPAVYPRSTRVDVPDTGTGTPGCAP